MDRSAAAQEMDNAQFMRWQQLIEERTGMFLTAQRRSFLQSQLNIRMRELNCSDCQAYYDLVINGSSGAIEWNTLVDRLTVQETRFFRDPDAFALVARFMQDKAAALSTKDSFECWSVGCSSGEEAYSLAILAEHYLAPLGIHYAINGTDISTPVLRKARQGIYPRKALQWVPLEFDTPNFIAQSGDKLQIAPTLRERCCFSQVNILELAQCPLHSQHIIYCQNVLIYFRRWRRREILNTLAERLVPGGVLIIGLGEMVDFHHPLLEQIPSNLVSAFIRKTNNIEMESARR